MFLARLDVIRLEGKEVTVNWRNLLVDNQGVFYTDANAYKMVRRDILPRSNFSRDGHFDNYYVPSYFYPVSAGIFIENRFFQEQMVVTNDRPQAGSAYQSGRIELLANRFTPPHDNLGVHEGAKDTDAMGMGVNVSARFQLKFTKERSEALRYIQERHLET